MKTFTAVLLLASIGSIMGIKCYVCTYGVDGSFNTDACLDPFDTNATSENLFYVECGTLATTSASDICGKAVLETDGNFTVARTCVSKADCIEENGCRSGNGATACCCGTDGCNGANGVAINIATTIALVFATVMFTL